MPHQVGKILGKGMISVAAGVTAAVIIATPGMAQKGRASSPMAEAFTFCETAANDMSGGAISAAGWTIDDQGEYGPFFKSINVSRNGGDDYGYVSVQPFATVELVYCTYDVYLNASFDLAAAAQALGFTGATQVVDGDTYGTWELTGDDGGKLVQATLSANYFYLEMSWIRDLP